MLASEAFKAAAVLLNDPNQITWNNQILLGPATQAYEELCNDLINNGFRLFHEVSSLLTVVTGGTGFDVPPTDMVEPIELEESAVGEEKFSPMQELKWEDGIKQTESLRYWAFRKNAVKFPGATTDRLVKMKYLRNDIGVLVSENSNLDLINGAGLLGAKIASICATHVAKNPKDGDAKELLYIRRLNTYIQIEVKNQQSLPVRRLPYTASRRG
jgi:hypothetical protein